MEGCHGTRKGVLMEQEGWKYESDAPELIKY